MKFIGAALFATLLALAAGCRSVPQGRITSSPNGLGEFRPYVRTMFRRIDREWRRGMAQLRLDPPAGSRVVIRFRLGFPVRVRRVLSFAEMSLSD